MSTIKVLLVDDEEDILELLHYALEKEGFEVFKAKNGLAGLETAVKIKPDIVLLDIMMPGVDGIEICRRIKAEPRLNKTKVFFLTARGEEYSEVAAFDAGADDYIVKPVKIRSLVKRLEMIFKKERNVKQSLIEAGKLRIDTRAYLVYLHEQEIRLPRKEFELLALLAQNPGKVVRRENILRDVWGTETMVVDRTIDVHIRRIRKRIGEEMIETVKGVGYKLVIENPTD